MNPPAPNRIQQRDGRPGVNKAAYGKREAAKPLSIAGKTYEHGCGTQAPSVPDGWPRMALRSVRAFDRTFDVVVERRGEGLRLTVSKEGKTVAEKELKTGDSAEIQLP